MSSGPPPVYTGAGQVQAVVQQPTIVQPAAAAPAVRSSGNWKGLQITGYIQVIAGVLSVGFGIIAIVLKAGVFFVGYPLWAGICFYIVAGILGIAAGGQQKKGLVVGYLTMSVIAAVVAIVMAIMSAATIRRDTFLCPDTIFHHYYRYDLCSTSSGSRIAMDCMIIVVAVAEGVAAIVGASFTCSGLCCSQAPSYPMQVYYQSAPQVFIPGQPQGAVQFAGVPQQQFVQQPQIGNVPYQGQVVVPPMQPQFQPAMQPQFQPAMQPQFQPAMQPPQGPVVMVAQAPAPAQDQAKAPPQFDGSHQPAPKQCKLPEDHDSKPLIT